MSECADTLDNLSAKSKKSRKPGRLTEDSPERQLELASQEQESVLDLSGLSSDLLNEQETTPRARTFANYVAGLLNDCAVSVYTLATDGATNFWLPRAVVGEAAVHDETISVQSGLLGELADEARPILRTATELKRHVRTTYFSPCRTKALPLPLFPASPNRQDSLRMTDRNESRRTNPLKSRGSTTIQFGEKSKLLISGGENERKETHERNKSREKRNKDRVYVAVFPSPRFMRGN